MKQTYTLNRQSVRDNVLARIKAAPDGVRVTFDDAKHSDDQRARFHAALGYFIERAIHAGRRLSEKTWKAVLLHELGREQGYEVEIVPSLDGAELIAVGRSTSDLSAKDYSALIDILYREAALQNIEIPEPRDDPNWRSRRERKQAAVSVGARG